MHRIFKPLLFLCFVFPVLVHAQNDPPIEEEEDEEEVDYSSFVQTMENKAFCSSRILGQLPIKLFSLGYDYQTSHTLEPITEQDDQEFRQTDIRSAQGARFAFNYPVISKNNIVLNLGVNYAETNYDMDSPDSETSGFLESSLEEKGLRTAGFTATVFKPLNIKRYIIAQVGLNLNGNYTLSDPQSLDYTRYIGALIYGIKANDRKIWGVGLSRTYLGGALNYVPVYYMLYTAENKKWGLEMLLPARFSYRRNIDSKNMLTLGWEVEGNTYRIDIDDDRYDLDFNDLELRRSELRLRASWEHALTSQIWFSLQAGYRYNWSFELDRGDFFRPFGDDTDYFQENDLSNPAYFNVSINWVSP